MGRILIRNAKIWVSGERGKNWMLFDETTGRVTDIGDGEPKPHLAENVQTTIDAKGARIFPGFHESHIHVSWMGKGDLECDLKGCASIDELQERVVSYANANPSKKWILGAGWEQDKLGRYPTCEDLDAICDSRPVLISRICEHIALANTAALQIAGIDENTKVSEGSAIDKFPVNHPKAGQPTGMLREFDAISLVTKHITYTRNEKFQWINKGLERCLNNGCTAVHSIEEGTWDEYKYIAQQDKLPIRVFVSAMWKEKDNANFPAFAGEQVGPLLSCDRIKIFADGGLGGATAALSLLYKGQDQSGLLANSQETMNSMVHEATAAGYRLEIHVIGDRAAESSIEAMEVARVAPEKRPLLTHCQVLREDLIPRMRNLGVIANIQPQFVTTDARWLDSLLPDALLPWSYAWKSLLKNGITCAGGSDAPVESPEPLIGIYDSIFRPNGTRDAQDQETFMPKECLSVREAIDLYTIAGAFTAMREHDLGKLLPGYFADFVIMEQDVDPVQDPKLFLTAKIQEVWVAGKRKK